MRKVIALALILFVSGPALVFALLSFFESAESIAHPADNSLVKAGSAGSPQPKHDRSESGSILDYFGPLEAILICCLGLLALYAAERLISPRASSR